MTYEEVKQARQEAEQRIRERATEYFTRDKSGKGYVCPLCGSGSGEKGTGITENPQSRGRFTCWTGCFKNADIFDIISLQFNLTSFNEQFDKACEIFGITPYERNSGNERRNFMKAETKNRPESNTKEDYTNFYNLAKKNLTHLIRELKPYTDLLLMKAPKLYEEITNFLDDFFISSHISSLSLIFDGKATQALGRARTNGVYDPFSRQLKVTNGVNIFLPDSVHKIGVGTAKLFRYAATKFTKLNSANEKGKNLNLRVFFDAKDFAAVTNTEITSEDTMKNLRRTIKKDLETLLHSSVEAEEKIKGQKTHYSGLNYIGKYDIKGNTIEIEFTLTMGEYLTSLPLLTYSQALYRINNREINAYAIGEALCLHYSQENNVVKETENKLRVETLLNYTSFPTWEELKEHKWSWEEKVKEPFERALDILTQCGFLKDYSLCYEGGIEISDEEMITGKPVDSYQKFISLILKYELNNFAPHQERLADITQKKAEQIALFKTRRKKNKKKADDNLHDE